MSYKIQIFKQNEMFLLKTASLTDFDELSASGVYRWGHFRLRKYIFEIFLGI